MDSGVALFMASGSRAGPAHGVGLCSPQKIALWNANIRMFSKLVDCNFCIISLHVFYFLSQMAGGAETATGGR